MDDLRIPKIQIQSTGKILDYKDFRQYSEMFIETGTAAGDGVQRALDAGFKEVISIEGSMQWFQQSQKRFLRNDNAFILHGNSVDILGDVIKPFTENTLVIFLDAHPSGPESFGHSDIIEKGASSEYSQDNIIKTELGIILKNSLKHIIIIDDVNGLTDGNAIAYCAMMLNANPAYKFYFYDECLSGEAQHFYKDKILVAIP